MVRVCTFAVAALVLSAGLAPAQTSTWNGFGGTTDWNTPGNWSPVGVPNSPTTSVLFTDTSAGTVNISASVMAQSLTFTQSSATYNLTSSAGQTLTVGLIVLNGGPSAITDINLANIAAGSLLFPGGTSLTIANNTPNGGSLVIGPNTVIGTPGGGGVIFGGPGATFLSGSFAVSPNNVVGGLTKTGPGLLDYSGSGASLAGTVTLNGGTLNLDYSGGTATKFTAGLALDGGLLLFTSNPGPPVTQSATATTVAAGHTDVRGSGIGTVTFNAAVISHSLGGTVDFTPSSSGPTFTIQTSTGNSSAGLLGTGPAFATVNGGANWAVQSGVVVAPLAGFSTNIYTSGANTDVTANSNQSGMTTNSLRFNVANLTLGLTGTNTLQSGGILVTPNGGGDQITGVSATLTAPSGSEILIHQYSSGPFTIGAALASTTGLTKTGPGTLTLSGNNTGLTGPINVNRGGLTVSGQTVAVNSASAINFNDDRATIGFGGLQTFTVALPAGNSGTINPPIHLAAFSATDYGTYFTSGPNSNTTVTLAGQISSAAGLTTPIRFTGPFDNTSGFNLTNTNTLFTGNVSLYQGSLGINADAALGNASNTLVLQVGDSVHGGLVFLNGGVTVARPVVMTFPSRVVSNGTDSNTISGPISGSGELVKDGTGTLTLSNSGNTASGGVLVSAGTLSLGATGSLPAGSNVTVAAGATFSPATTAVNEFGTVTLNGGTFKVPTGSGLSVANVITTSSAGGTLDFTGSTAAELNVAGSIAINGNSTWLSPGNSTVLSTPSGPPVPIIIAPGVRLNNGIALLSGSAFLVTGGGTLFQNSDATNVGNMGAAVTVAQGSTFRVVDVSSNLGVGNLGAGTFTLDGGTFSFGGTGAPNATIKAIALTGNGGAIAVELPATTLTANGPITGLGGLTKIGPGTLVLGNVGNSFTSLTINAGTVQTAADGALGGGPVTINPGGTLAFTGTPTTSRTFNLNSGTLTVGGGANLTLAGATVNGGFLRGAGTYTVTGGTAFNGGTTFTSTTISQTGPGSYTNFTHGGTLAIAAGIATPIVLNGFSNQGSGTITVGAGSQISAADFQTYGYLSIAAGPSPSSPSQLTNNGSTPMYFNGGSRTFVSDVAHISGPAYVDIHGQDAIVAGGLFVNNGAVFDSLGSPASHHNLIADYGATIKGAGAFQFTPVTQNGGKFSPGNSPGAASFGEFKVGLGGVSNYVFQIDDATGTAGPSPDAQGHVSGWGLARAVPQIGPMTTSGDFVWGADSAHPLSVAIDTLVNPTTVGTDVAGPMAHFDPSLAYSWTAVEWTGSYSGPTNAAVLNATTAFDTSGIVNPFSGSFGWDFGPDGHSLDLTYTPVPEPGTLLLVGAAGLGLGWVRRRASGA
jgi:autotransporter-associated beta strand protein